MRPTWGIFHFRLEKEECKHRGNNKKYSKIMGNQKSVQLEEWPLFSSILNSPTRILIFLHFLFVVNMMNL